jgi:hypothetical protein
VLFAKLKVTQVIVTSSKIGFKSALLSDDGWHFSPQVEIQYLSPQQIVWVTSFEGEMTTSSIQIVISRTVGKIMHAYCRQLPKYSTAL